MRILIPVLIQLRKSGQILKLALFIITLSLLAACNSGSLTEGLESAANPQPGQNIGSPSPSSQTAALNTAQGLGGQTPIDATGNSQSANQFASVASGKPVAFLPVSNAPQTAISALSASIRKAAADNQVPIVASIQEGAAYQVKGYFSALEDGSGTLLVYVWDILDRNNKRVYRISGQETSSNKSADPWSSVTSTMIDRVAVSTLSQLRSWLSTKG